MKALDVLAAVVLEDGRAWATAAAPVQWPMASRAMLPADAPGAWGLRPGPDRGGAL